MERIITEELLGEYGEYLYEEEKAPSTIKKYMRDLRKLLVYADGKEITKRLMVEYKEDLRIKQKFKLRSINTFLVAANRLFEYLEWFDLRIKIYQVQQDAFLPESKDLSKQDYRQLIKTAKQKGKNRLEMILQTMCGTGIRISELGNITVESVQSGIVEIYNKGKQRKILLSRKLQQKLLLYIKKNQITEGVVFCTSKGKAVDRSNVWREMKKLSMDAEVEEEKVFPHNLRHLFSKAFYEVDKDIAKLADVLGHSNIETTRLYIMTTSKEYQKQLDRMQLV